MNMTESERSVMRYLDTEYGIQLRKIPESNSKSPDFELVNGETRALVLEVKEVEDVPVSAATGWTIREVGFGITEAERQNNCVSRVAKKICDAVKQLKQYREPKGLVFFNTDHRVQVRHLNEAYCGEQVYSNGELAYRNVASKRISEGRLKHVKNEIDFFIWIDCDDRVIRKPFFRYVSEAGRTILVRYFKAPPGLDVIRARTQPVG